MKMNNEKVFETTIKYRTKEKIENIYKGNNRLFIN